MDSNMLREYLDRIGLCSVPEITPDGLRQVQRAYIEHVPFENLDIIEGRIPLALDEQSLFDKMIRSNRGGICYEQNLLYCSALKAMGFNAHMRGAGAGDTYERLDHAFVMVAFPIDDATEPALKGAYDGYDWWLTDVGFGFNYAVPLHAIPGLIQSDGRDDYRIDEIPEFGEGFLRVSKAEDGVFQPMLTFGPQEFTAKDFQPQCDIYSFEEGSYFRSGPVICIDTPEQRLTLSGNHFIETIDGVKHVTEIDSPDMFEKYLWDIFKIQWDRS